MFDWEKFRGTTHTLLLMRKYTIPTQMDGKFKNQIN